MVNAFCSSVRRVVFHFGTEESRVPGVGGPVPWITLIGQFFSARMFVIKIGAKEPRNNGRVTQTTTVFQIWWSAARTYNGGGYI